MGINKKNDIEKNEYPFVAEYEGGSIILAKLDALINWSRANSLWPLTFGTRCCAIEFMAAGASRHDFARFGAEVARATPRKLMLLLYRDPSITKWLRFSKGFTIRWLIPNM